MRYTVTDVRRRVAVINQVCPGARLELERSSPGDGVSRYWITREGHKRLSALGASAAMEELVAYELGYDDALRYGGRG